MANLYVKVALTGASQDQAAAHPAALPCDAHVPPAVGGVTIVCEALSEIQNHAQIRAFAGGLSERFRRPALARGAFPAG